MYTYNPASIINPQRQLNSYLNEQMMNNARNGARQAMGNPPSAETRVAAAIGGALLAKLIWDLLDR